RPWRKDPHALLQPQTREGRRPMTCPNCGAANPPGKKFCSQCGTKLSMACPNCGAALEGNERFCGECGTPLQPASATSLPASASGNGPIAAPASERRLVSVLFAD